MNPPHRRLRDAADRRGAPLATIVVTVAVVVLTYLAGKLAYRIPDVLLMIAVTGFVSLDGSTLSRVRMVGTPSWSRTRHW